MKIMTIDSEGSETPITRLARGAGISLIGRGLGRGLTMVGQVVIARLLGPAAYGLYGIGWTLLRMGGLVAALGLDQAVIRFASPERSGDGRARAGVILRGLLTGLLFGAAVGALLFLSAPWLAEKIFGKAELGPILRWFAPGLALASALKIAAESTRVSQRMQYGVAAEEIAQPASNLALVFIAYIAGYGVAGAAAAGSISFGLALLLAFRYLIRLFPEISWDSLGAAVELRVMVAFAVPASLARLFSTLLLSSDRLFVGAFLPESQVGIYQAASLSSTIFAIILAAFNAIFAPMVAEIFHQEGAGDLQEVYRVSTKWGLYLSIVPLLLLLLVPELILTGIFGPEFAAGVGPLRVLALGQFLNVAVGAVGLLLTMAGHPRRWMAISLAALLLEVALSLILIPRLGLTGGALAISLALAAVFITGLFQVQTVLGLWPYDRRFGKGLLAGLLALVALLLGKGVLQLPALLELIALGVLVSAVFIVVLIALGFDEEDKSLLRLLQRR